MFRAAQAIDSDWLRLFRIGRARPRRVFCTRRTHWERRLRIILVSPEVSLVEHCHENSQRCALLARRSHGLARRAVVGGQCSAPLVSRVSSRGRPKCAAALCGRSRRRKRGADGATSAPVTPVRRHLRTGPPLHAAAGFPPAGRIAADSEGVAGALLLSRAARPARDADAEPRSRMAATAGDRRADGAGTGRPRIPEQQRCAVLQPVAIGLLLADRIVESFARGRPGGPRFDPRACTPVRAHPRSIQGLARPARRREIRSGVELESSADATG